MWVGNTDNIQYFFAGLVLKDPLFKEMEDTVYSYNYQDYSDGTGYGMGHSYMVGDPTRLFASDDFNEDDLGNLNLATDAVYGSQAQRFRDRYTYSNDQGSYKDKSHSDFETVAALMDITMNHVGEYSDPNLLKPQKIWWFNWFIIVKIWSISWFLL